MTKYRPAFSGLKEFSDQPVIEVKDNGTSVRLNTRELRQCQKVIEEQMAKLGRRISDQGSMLRAIYARSEKSNKMKTPGTV